MPLSELLDRVSSSPKLRAKMAEFAARSREAGVEMGFPICLPEGGEPMAGEDEATKGTDVSMSIVRGCPISKGDFLGTWHYHAQGALMPSRQDFATLADGKERVMCTGQGERVFCVQPKEHTGPRDIKRTIERLTDAGLGELPDEQTYAHIVGRHFFIREFRLQVHATEGTGQL